MPLTKSFSTWRHFASLVKKTCQNRQMMLCDRISRSMLLAASFYASRFFPSSDLRADNERKVQKLQWSLRTKHFRLPDSNQYRRLQKNQLPKGGDKQNLLFLRNRQVQHERNRPAWTQPQLTSFFAQKSGQSMGGEIKLHRCRARTG